MIDIKRIAYLARITLSEEEKEKFQKELSAILGFFEKLNELDTQETRPVTGGTHLKDQMRSDEQAERLLEGKIQELLNAAPEKKDGWVKVKKIL